MPPDGWIFVHSTMNSRDGFLLHALRGHAGCALGVALFEDGTFAVSAEDALLWNVVARQFLCAFSGHTDLVTGISMSRTGETVASSSSRSCHSDIEKRLARCFDNLQT